MLYLVSSLNVVTRNHVVRWDVMGELRFVQLCHVSGVQTFLLHIASQGYRYVLRGHGLNEQ